MRVNMRHRNLWYPRAVVAVLVCCCERVCRSPRVYLCDYRRSRGESYISRAAAGVAKLFITGPVIGQH